MKNPNYRICTFCNSMPFLYILKHKTVQCFSMGTHVYTKNVKIYMGRKLIFKLIVVWRATEGMRLGRDEGYKAYLKYISNDFSCKIQKKPGKMSKCIHDLCWYSALLTYCISECLEFIGTFQGTGGILLCY